MTNTQATMLVAGREMREAFRRRTLWIVIGIIFVGSGKIAYGKLAQALEHGALTLQIAGDFDDAMARVQQVARQLGMYLVNSVNQCVYTVGRLDEASEGLLLLTNDCDLANRLMHPRFGVEKTYLVQVAGKPSRDDVAKLLQGVWLSDGHVKAKRVKRLRSQGESTWLEIVLCEGKNREVRRMLARLGHKVMRLRRIALGRVHLGRLGVGRSRPLKPEELEALRKVAEGVRRRDQRKKVRVGESRQLAPRVDAEINSRSELTTFRQPRKARRKKPR